MFTVVSENRGDFLGWARQFVRHDPSNRSMVRFAPVRQPRRLLSKVEQVYADAARSAGNGGTVIISVGHGGSRADRGGGLGAGMADLAPNRALRINRANVFYRMAASDARVDAEATRISRRHCRQMLNRFDLDESETPEGRRHPSPPDPHAYAMCSGAPSARSRLLIRRCYDAIGRQLRNHGITDVLFLSCNIGNATRFVDKIAEDWGVRVSAYTRRVAVIQDAGDKYRVYLNGDRPGTGTNTERGRVETPNADMYTSGAT